MMFEQIEFNLVELSFNNILQVRFKVYEGNTTENLRCSLDSRQDLSSAPQLVRDLAAEFPYEEFTNPDGPCSHVDFIRVLDSERYHILYQFSDYVYKDGQPRKQSKRRPVHVLCTDDLSIHPEKVQKFASLVFTPDVIENFKSQQRSEV